MKKEEFLVRGLTGKPNVFRNGILVPVPADWCFVPSGDPLLTRRIKTGGEYWVHVHERKGRLESLGIWAPLQIVNEIQKAIAEERNDPSYQKRLEYAKKNREKKQVLYCQDLKQAIINFLHFHPDYTEYAELLADAVVAKSAAVGSGTVARSQRISIEQRAESAVIAWMRHQTTTYDNMKIARVKGRRYEVRRELAKQSRSLLDGFRNGSVSEPENNPLILALKKNDLSKDGI